MRIMMSDFIDEFAKRGYTKADARLILDDFEDTVSDLIGKGYKVILNSFLQLEPVMHSPTRGFNFHTGKDVDIEGRASVRVRPGDKLKRAAAQYFADAKYNEDSDGVDDTAPEDV